MIGDYNRMGGIGSTSSFQAMVHNSDYTERFLTFYTRRPNPVFVRVPGYERRSYAATYYPDFKISFNEIEHFGDYVSSFRSDNDSS